MATVYRKTVTKPLPENAEIITRKGERLARWKDGRGKTRTAPLTTGRDGSGRIVFQAGTFTAKYRDGQGIVREVATGCRDETAARSVLADLERRAELVKAKVFTATEDMVANHQETPIRNHFHAYLTKLEVDGTSKDHRGNVRRCLNRIAAECGLSKLRDLTREELERWLLHSIRGGMGARTRNLHRASAVAFCTWCVESGRLATNPLTRVKKADEETDRRRKRRAMTESEVLRLLEVARRRPLLDAMTVRHGKRKGQAVANLREETKAKLELLGWERCLIYKGLVLTGLRKKELKSLTVGQLQLEGQIAYATLNASDEKNREGSEIPIRADLAVDLREWLDFRLSAFQAEAKERGELVPSRLPADMRIFRVPRDMVRILDRDLKMAGIPKIDERGRTLDIHALRTSFGTFLSTGGVPPRTAQAAMRHSSIDLTMNVYTDPALLDVAGALDELPALPLDGPPANDNDDKVITATGTDGADSQFAPGFAPKTDKRGQSKTFWDNRQKKRLRAEPDRQDVASSYAVNENKPLKRPVNDLEPERETGFEPATSSLGS